MSLLFFCLHPAFPELDRAVPGGAGEAFAVRKKGDAADAGSVALECLEVAAGGLYRSQR